jgi:phosphoserine aminotransferase
MKVNNFSAGPSKIPNKVINQVSKDILDYQNLGYSVLEISHRSKVFEEILDNVKAHLYDLLKIPENFDIFFLQGGATFQNTFIPANKPSLIDNLLFLISGTWGKKTFQDFERYHNQNFPSMLLNDKTYEELKTKIDNNDEKYLYITSNETIEGLQIRNFNNFENKELIIDMSSDICSYVFDWKNISYVYAGAQKNLGIPGVTICISKKGFLEKSDLTSYIDAQNHIDKDSAFNTPPTFSIYVMLKILEWIFDSGGLEKIQSDNEKKAKLLYKFLDDNSDKFNMSVPKEFRSNANIVFDFKDSKITSNFLQSSIEKGFLGLNGHRSIGGVRVSNYNSISDEMMNDLITHLKGFI